MKIKIGSRSSKLALKQVEIAVNEMGIKDTLNYLVLEKKIPAKIFALVHDSILAEVQEDAGQGGHRPCPERHAVADLADIRHNPPRSPFARCRAALRMWYFDADAGLCQEFFWGGCGGNPDNRFDAAYKCIMQCAMLGLWANGYRTATSQPGHHQTAIQSLGLTIGVAQPDIIVLDALRRQRNVSDYEGDPISNAALQACIEQAAQLLAGAEGWLRAHRPDLLSP